MTSRRHTITTRRHAMMLCGDTGQYGVTPWCHGVTSRCDVMMSWRDIMTQHQPPPPDPCWKPPAILLSLHVKSQPICGPLGPNLDGFCVNNSTKTKFRFCAIISTGAVKLMPQWTTNWLRFRFHIYGQGLHINRSVHQWTILGFLHKFYNLLQSFTSRENLLAHISHEIKDVCMYYVSGSFNKGRSHY